MRETLGSRPGNGRFLSWPAPVPPAGPAAPNPQSWRPPGRGGWMFNNADEVSAYIRDNDVKFVDVRFCDLPGVMQHFTVPAESFDARLHRGPDVRRFLDPRLPGDPRVRHAAASRTSAPHASTRFRKDKTLNINFFIHDPITGEQYTRDPRNVAKKAEAYLAGTGIADTAYFGPEAEFYVFDDVRFETKQSTVASTTSTPRPAAGTPDASRSGRQPRLQGALQGRLLPGPAGGPLRRPARRDGRWSSQRIGLQVERRTTRSARPARPRSTTSSTRCWPPPTT